ncbi:hypothetical protein ABC977_03875 [Thioalkalicoccus limnaeus]|uniref:Fido domain-containing protein n=1 Tax=Thioalkalicoccus limnaeus TaxID=120681 RepID=A0ABV4BCL6_9GAMM
MRLDLAAIDAALRAVQADFARLSPHLGTPRDPMTDMVRDHLLDGYRLVDEALRTGLDPFAPGHSRWLLELNRRVLCGTDATRRREYAEHLRATERHFYDGSGGGIGALIEWLARHRGADIWQRAAGLYIQLLSQPQLFLEGNHRTGVLVVSYLLAREGHLPFVLSVANARVYFDLSARIKHRRRDGLALLVAGIGIRRQLVRLLREESAVSRSV